MSKKVLSILFAAALITGFAACGMSEEEKKADSIQQDSVISETQSTADSLFEMMERENAIADSIAKADSARMADSLAKLKK